MSNRIVFLLLLLFCSLNNVSADSVIQMDNTHIFFRSSSLCLQFVLNTETKEAMLGNGIDRDHNALFDPRNPYAPYNPDEPGPNWYSIDVPETISFDGDTYTVTSVAPNAFYKSTEVNYITLPNTIRSIGGSAFGYCTYLKEVNIPEGVERIEEYTFYICKKMKEIHLPSTIKSIGYYAFGDCQALETISIPSGCTTISDEAFTLCLGLKNLTFEDGDEPLVLGYAYDKGIEPVLQTSDFRGLFSDCPLKNIYIGRDIQIETERLREYSPFEGVRQIGDGNGHYNTYHNGWKEIDKVEFGDKVKNICDNLLKDLYINSEIVLPKNVESIGAYAFRNVIDQQQLIIPSHCQKIGAEAFSDNSSSIGDYTLRVIKVLASTPPEIAISTFSGHKDFILEVPDNSGSLYREHEYWGKSPIVDNGDELVSVEVRYGGTLYGKLAYMDKSPEMVTRLKVKGPLNDDDISVIKEMKLFELDLSEVPMEDISSLSSILKNLRCIKFPNTLKEIGNKLFWYGNIKGPLTIPASCEKIGSNAFYGSVLDEVIIEGPTVVESGAFTYCRNLENITFKGEGAVATENSFHVSHFQKKNTGLKTLIIGGGARIEELAFAECYNLQEIIIDGVVEEIGKSAFSGSENLKSITFNGEINNLHSSAFNSNIKLEEVNIVDLAAWCRSQSGQELLSLAEKKLINGEEPVHLVLPDGVETTGGFAGFDKLTEVVLPESIVSINDNAFKGCTLLEKINIPESVKSIGNNAFSGCAGLLSISVPNNVEQIGNGAFAGCMFSTITLPYSLKSVPYGILENCTNLKSVVIQNNTNTIEDYAFSGCTSLQEVVLPGQLTHIGSYAFKGCESLENCELPTSVTHIDAYAFENCTLLSKVTLPYHLNSIGEYAYKGCTSLKNIEALWCTPIQVSTNTFNGISSKAILWVPVGTVPTYIEKGWGRIPLIEDGFCVLNNNVSAGIQLAVNGKEIKTGDCAKVDIGGEAEIHISLQDFCYLTSFTIDDYEALSDIEDNVLRLENIEDNKNLSAMVKKYMLGDVNDDNYIDVGDISAIVRIIQQNFIENFELKAADVNRDGDIDVGDITGTVNLIYEYSNKARGRYFDSMSYDNDKDLLIDAQISYSYFEKQGVLSVNLASALPVCGFQFEFALPEGYYLPVDENDNYVVDFCEDRVGNMNIKTITSLQNGNYLCLCSSTNRNEVKGNDGDILKIPFFQNNKAVSNNDSIVISHIKLSDSSANVYLQDDELRLLVHNNTTSIVPQTDNASPRDGKFVHKGHLYIKKNGVYYNVNGTNDMHF